MIQVDVHPASVEDTIQTDVHPSTYAPWIMATNSQHQETPEYRTFREHYARLYHAIQDPLSLVTQLYSQGIIAPAVKEQMSVLGVSRLEKNNVLLSAVEMQIQTDASVLRVFFTTLNEDPSMQSLVESMQRGLLSTTSGAHGGGGPVESRNGGEELSTPAVKRKCVRESLVSGLESESVYCPLTPNSVTHQQYHCEHQYCRQYHSTSQHPSQPLYHPQFHPPTQMCHPPPHPPVQPHLTQPPNYPFQSPLVQPSYQHAELTQPPYNQPSYHPPNPPPSKHAHPPTSQNPFQKCFFHQPPFRTPTPHPLPVFSNSPLGKYALYLQACYTKHQFTSNKWPHLDARKYINLAVISNEYANRKELVEFRKQTICGSIDDILEWKAPIELKDILKPNCAYDIDDDDELRVHEHYQVTQVLIEGAPGIGKSTFAWEVCQKWGQHQLFNEYSLVVLLKLRDKRVQEAKSVTDLFYHPNPKLQSEIVDYITESEGYGLLLILEGFDEAPERTLDSIFVQLFTGEVLPNATVILTTRPSASVGLRQFCNSVYSRKIEIVGFGKKEINEYIRCAFSDEQTRSDFKEYLSLYPHIRSMMYVPLNSAIVTHVYESCKSSGAVVPKTMTQLYSSLIRTLLLRYLKDKEEYKDTCTTVNSFKDLPQPVYDQFCEICEIAYTGIMSAETELIFQDLPSDFDPLGLMQSCPELYVDWGTSVSYNFLHLTVQEYLAAYHISQQSSDEQVAFMREHIESKKLEVVVRFLAGLTELGRELWDVVRGFANEVYGSFLGKKKSFIKQPILHLLFESQDPSAITSVLNSECVCFRPIGVLPFNLYVLGYCITHSSCDWKLVLEHCDLEPVEIFLRALNLQQDQCQLSSTGKIKEMWLWQSDLAAVRLLVENMSQMLVFHNLTHLGLKCDLKSEICNFLCKETDLLQHLECLNLGGNLSGDNNIGRGGAVNLITSLTKFSTIRELYLCDTGIGFEDCKALSGLLASSKYIQVLDISENMLLPDCIQLIVDGLSLNISLETLYIHCSNLSSENVLSIASVLRLNTNLKELDIGSCNIQSSDSVHLAKALEENTTTQLQTLWLPCNSVGAEGAVAFADMLATNKSLNKLGMGYCNIQGEGVVCLAKALEKNSTVKKLHIHGNLLGSEGAVAFADMLATNKSLDSLYMNCCIIQAEGAVCLAKVMEKNFTLREFNISDNPIGSEGAAAFASMLATNQFLKILRLKDDSVGVEGALELIESLKHNTTLESLWLSEKYKPPSFSTLDKALQGRVIFSSFMPHSPHST